MPGAVPRDDSYSPGLGYAGGEPNNVTSRAVRQGGTPWELSNVTKMLSGLILITVPSREYGGADQAA
jgi:hypothetical protein